VPSGGGDKNPPYSFQQARRRIVARMAAVASALSQIPDDAAPNGQVVAVMTMHPRYVSKSDFPTDLLNSLGLSDRQPLADGAAGGVGDSKTP